MRKCDETLKRLDKPAPPADPSDLTTGSVPMAKSKFERNKPHVNIGTIGHVDHGKT
ncbi:hypothetical protein GOA59_31735, partial [Sinorhizobium meliloti]|nr:hypothetical protein [Sinorhizobium meliloti]MDX0572195.1 hypothetical protein [Sinorhizobium medicae]MDW9389257.1 hypothetical protein [Sinorhizobium meliloti]MDW9395229.1 hypothetical protein [Sinorhizobium meliloti]MDW9401264.1 hypothetical protein [Sinorhizobium meliloti]